MKMNFLKHLISFLSGCFVASAVFYFFHFLPNHFELYLCHESQLSYEEKSVIQKKYQATPNPFFNIPNWYPKRILPFVKNFYIQNISTSTDIRYVTKSEDIYSWEKNAYLELESGDIYEVTCIK